MRSFLALTLGCLVFATGCKGEMTQSGDPPTTASENNQSSSANNSVEVNTEVAGVGTVGIRRLSQRELDDTLFFLLGDTSMSAVALPEDNVDPFDNDWEGQRVSQALVEALENVASNVAESAMADPQRRQEIVGCEPSGPDDAACFQQFVENFGRKALRRPLTQDERTGLMSLQKFSTESGDFYVGARLVIQTLLQMPGFVYHVQRGVPVEGREDVFRLTHFEVASRLSYFIWGTPPDDVLLDAAANGELGDPEAVRDQATRMLQDERARQRMYRFHALWMGYHRFEATDSLGASMQAETERLIDRVIFEEQRNYFDLFTINETYMNDELAEHYGVDVPGSVDGVWVTYPDTVDRGGILSHASFLGVAAKFGDTSPTQRGRVIRGRLMCQPIQPPPANLEVDVDAPPPATAESNCKADRYQAILDQQGCAVCHTQMDPIGLGLEKYDQFGRYRETDVGEPECIIEGTGELVGVGTFSGPRELGEKLVESRQLESCLIDRVFQFATAAKPDPDNRELRASLRQSFEDSGYRFDQLILEVAGSEAFLYRHSPQPEVNP